MLGEHLQGDFLGKRDGIVVADTHDEIIAAIGIACEVANRAFEDGRIGDLHLIAIECHQNSRARGQPLNVSRDVGYFYQIALTKRLLQAQKETGEKVLGDVAECNAQHQTNQACAAHQR